VTGELGAQARNFTSSFPAGPDIPANATVLAFTPHDAVLERASVAVTVPKSDV
jgi:UDP:flavonoid glycosyltransferase YjiC (YdhE family)